MLKNLAVLVAFSVAGVAATDLHLNNLAFNTPCLKYNELRNAGHMDIGVLLVVKDERVRAATSEALNRWSQVIDMTWHEDRTSTCALTIVEAPVAGFRYYSGDRLVTNIPPRTARAQLPQNADTFKGIVFVNTARLLSLDKYWMADAMQHELGHLFGYNSHSDNPRSIMYWNVTGDNQKLQKEDVKVIARYHKTVLHF